MRIGIIGIGAVGGTLARKLVMAGHDVKVANSRGKDAVKGFANEIGAKASDLYDISNNLDVLILSVPYTAIEHLKQNALSTLSDDVIVVDTANYYPEIRGSAIKGLGNGEVESMWLAKQINHSVIKTFNTLLAESLSNRGKERGEVGRLAMQIAGDSVEQKEKVKELIEECGFDPLDIGSIEESWKMQPNSAGYCCDYTVEELIRIKKMSKQTPKSVAEKRLYLMKHFADITGGDYTHENVIKVNRIINN